MELTSQQRDELVSNFLEYACADPILANGPAAHARRSRTALRILKRYPEIAHANIHTAVVCGDLTQAERILAERPEAATEPGGPQRRRHLPEREKLWTPLLHLCYGRLPVPAASENAVALARLLLDHGANPNDYFECGSHPCRYTTLCGVAGEGEDDAPPHPQREALMQLLLERGAEPYDIQLTYNTHFHGNILWILKLMYVASMRLGRKADWEDPNWSMLAHGGFGCGARYFLGIAVNHNNLELARWILEHGASPDAPASEHPRQPKDSLYKEAVRRGFTEMAGLLVQYGATPEDVTLDGLDQFIAASLQGDRELARAMAAQHPDYLRSPKPIFLASRQDRSDVVEFLLDLGVSLEIEDENKQRPLHIAASSDSLNTARLLVERGAELGPVETNWNNTPLDFALYSNLPRMTEFLSNLSRDVFRLTWIGNVPRLRELLDSQPELATVVDEGSTPLMWLPDDESRSVECVQLLLAHGADVSIRDKEGNTAADIAEKRALYDAAELLRHWP
jgi:uncharacterized protein